MTEAGAYDGPLDSKRKRLLALMTALESERSVWLPRWQRLADFYLPYAVEITPSQRNRQGQSASKIIDAHATKAADRTRAGMVGGTCSAVRDWFLITTPDAELNEFAPVKLWLDAVTELLWNIFLKSNLYNAVPLLYLDQLVFGTSAMLAMEDDRDIIRFYNLPIGSYSLAASDRRVVDTMTRTFTMTARQMRSRFVRKEGDIEKLSLTVRSALKSGNTEQTFEVCHAIYPNDLYDEKALGPRTRKWAECYWEKSGSAGETSGAERYLDENSYNEFPVLAPRWDVTGDDVYGTSPGLRALPDVMSLQSMARQMHNAIEFMTKPPVNVPSSLQNRAVNWTPGGANQVDVMQGQRGIEPIQDWTKIPVNYLGELMAQTRERISALLYEELFTPVMNDQRPQRATAQELRMLAQEQMAALGPVVERQEGDFFKPLIDRAFNIAWRRGLVPTPPREVEGMELKVEFTSILSQARKLASAGAIEQAVAFVTAIAPIVPAILDKLDFDEAVDQMADVVSAPPQLVRSDQDVADMRNARAKQQASMQAAASAPGVAKAAKDLSETDVSGDNALTRLAGAAAGAA